MNTIKSILIIISFLAFFSSLVWFMTSAPCESFAGFTLNQTPVRCLIK